MFWTTSSADQIWWCYFSICANLFWTKGLIARTERVVALT